MSEKVTIMNTERRKAYCTFHQDNVAVLNLLLAKLAQKGDKNDPIATNFFRATDPTHGILFWETKSGERLGLHMGVRETSFEMGEDEDWPVKSVVVEHNIVRFQFVLDHNEVVPAVNPIVRDKDVISAKGPSVSNFFRGLRAISPFAGIQGHRGNNIPIPFNRRVLFDNQGDRLLPLYGDMSYWYDMNPRSSMYNDTHMSFVFSFTPVMAELCNRTAPGRLRFVNEEADEDKVCTERLEFNTGQWYYSAPVNSYHASIVNVDEWPRDVYDTRTRIALGKPNLNTLLDEEYRNLWEDSAEVGLYFDQQGAALIFRTIESGLSSLWSKDHTNTAWFLPDATIVQKKPIFSENKFGIIWFEPSDLRAALENGMSFVNIEEDEWVEGHSDPSSYAITMSQNLGRLVKHVPFHGIQLDDLKPGRMDNLVDHLKNLKKRPKVNMESAIVELDHAANDVIEETL